MPGKGDKTCSPVRTTGGQVDGEPRPLWPKISVLPVHCSHVPLVLLHLNARFKKAC